MRNTVIEFIIGSLLRRARLPSQSRRGIPFAEKYDSTSFSLFTNCKNIRHVHSSSSITSTYRNALLLPRHFFFAFFKEPDIEIRERTC